MKKYNTFKNGYPHKKYKTLGLLNEEEVLNNFKENLKIYESIIGDARAKALESFKKDMEDKFLKMKRPYNTMENFIESSLNYIDEVITDNYKIVLFNYLVDLVNAGLRVGDFRNKKEIGYYGIIEAIIETSSYEFMDIDTIENVNSLLFSVIEDKKSNLYR